MHTKTKKDPLTGKGVDGVRRPLWPWAVVDQRGPRDRAGYLPPPFSGRRVPLPRPSAWSRLVPGLPRGRQALSGAPRPDAQVHLTAGTAAPSVRVSHQRAAHRTMSAGTKRGIEEELAHRGDRAGETHEPRRESLSLAFGPPFRARGSARRSAPFAAPPPFEAFPEASRKGACPLTPSPHVVRGTRKSVLAQVQGIISSSLLGPLVSPRGAARCTPLSAWLAVVVVVWDEVQNNDR